MIHTSHQLREYSDAFPSRIKGHAIWREGWGDKLSLTKILFVKFRCPRFNATINKQKTSAAVVDVEPSVSYFKAKSIVVANCVK